LLLKAKKPHKRRIVHAASLDFPLSSGKRGIRFHLVRGGRMFGVGAVDGNVDLVAVSELLTQFVSPVTKVEFILGPVVILHQSVYQAFYQNGNGFRRVACPRNMSANAATGFAMRSQLSGWKGKESCQTPKSVFRFVSARRF
jgi:hypothetical protein